MGGLMYPLPTMLKAYSVCTSINSISTHFKQQKQLFTGVL